MKKTIAVILTLAMLLCLAACGGGPAANQGELSNDEASKSFKVGLNNFILGLQVQDLMQRYSEDVLGIVGSSVMPVNDEGSVEKTLSNAQNLISSGVDAMIVFVVADNLALSIGQMCEQNNIPFVLNCSAITDPEVKEALTGMTMFVGLVSDNHYAVGCSIAEHALESGCTTAILSAAEYGSYTQDTKINGFRDTFEAGGGKILAEARCNSASSDNMNTVTDDLIVSNLDADCFFCANILVANAAAENLAKYGDSTDMMLMSSECDSEMCEYLRKGMVESSTYASYPDNIFSTILLYNYLIGNPILDENGKPPYLESLGTSVVTPEMTGLFEKIWFEGDPFSEDYIASMCDGTLTYEKFVSEIESFDLNKVFSLKLADGTITEEELADAGVTLK